MLDGSGLALALALVAAGIETPVVEGVVVTQSVRPYLVTGGTSRRLLEEMNALGPVSPGTGRRNFGQADTQVAWTYTFRARDGRRCQIDRSQVKLHIRITLPQWQPAGEPTGALREQWDAFHAALTRHELGHRAFGIAAAEQIRQALDQLPPTDCQDIESQIERATSPIMQRMSDANRTYDADTGHGRTEGAFWQAD